MACIYWMVLIVWVVVCNSLATVSEYYDLSDLDEHRLVKRLFRNYGKINPTGSVRPVHNHKNTTRVKFGVTILNILSLDDESGDIHVNVWEDFEWKDEFLTWDPDEFGDITQINVDPQPFWFPDFTLLNSLQPGNRYAQGLAMVLYDGNYFLPHRTTRKVRCARENVGWLDDSRFMCKMRYGMQNYGGDGIDLQLRSESIHLELQPGSRYSITNVYAAEREENTGPEMSYTYLTYTFSVAFN